MAGESLPRTATGSDPPLATRLGPRVLSTVRRALPGRRPLAQVGPLLAGAATTAAAIPAALIIYAVNELVPSQPERALYTLAICLAVPAAVPTASYVLVRRRLADAGALGLVVLSTVSVLLVSIYLYWVSFYVRFPADILIWSEGEFVNDILKFRLGYPLYSPQQNSESFIYTPGSQLLTYLLAWATGNPTSIPVYRGIQVGYTALAAVAAFLCCWKLVSLSLLPRALRYPALLGAFWLPILLLIASNPFTNPFVHALHNDSLAQLVSIAAYWLLLDYVSGRRPRTLALMAVVPAVGFAVKQSLVIWALLFFAQLALFDQPRSFKRMAAFALACASGLALVIGTGYLLWRDDFVYWIFFLLSKEEVSPLRSLKHILDVWPFFVLGLLGAVLLLRGRAFQPLLGPWLVWLVFILAEAWSSGIAWMLNHLGPGSLMGSVWFLVGIARLWSVAFRPAAGARRMLPWVRAGIGVAVISLLLSGLGVVRVPIAPFTDSPYAYVKAIEREFEGQPAATVLLDVGTWVYLPSNVVMKDRGSSTGDRGGSGTGDFSGLIARLEKKHYSKILVRNLHSPHFAYDHFLWDRSNGVREVLLNNYVEVGTIPAVEEKRPGWMPTPGFTEISVLVPRG